MLDLAGRVLGMNAISHQYLGDEDGFRIEGRPKQEIPIVRQLVFAESLQSVVEASTEDQIAARDGRVVPKEREPLGRTGSGTGQHILVPVRFRT